MKFIRLMIIATFAAMVFFLPKMAYAVDVTMGSNGNLVFDPDNITISSGETLHFHVE
jgi:plastocyanin